MNSKEAATTASKLRNTIATATLALLAACTEAPLPEGPFAPGVDTRGEAVDGVEVGNRLLHAGEYELALDAFTRAALDHGMSQDVLIGIGTSNIGLGRLGQAERQLRDATERFPDSPEAWNNLGVVLMERGQIPEATQVFRRAYALDNGESDSIRDNLRLALAKSENPDNNEGEQDPYKVVQRSIGEFEIRKTP